MATRITMQHLRGHSGDPERWRHALPPLAAEGAPAARRAPEPLGENPPGDVLLTVDWGSGPVEVPARCYAIEPPHLYVHLADEGLAQDLPAQARVLLTTAPARRAEWQFLTAGWGRLERVDDQDLAPHLRSAPEHPQPIWRVRLDSGGRAAVGWGPGGRGALQ